MDHEMGMNMTTGPRFTNSSGTFEVDCYGEEFVVALSGGTFRGHFIPGIIFLSWGVFWALQASSRHLRAQLTGSSAEALGWHEVSCGWLRLAEPLLKAFGTPLGILVELRLDHPKWLPLFCPDGSFIPRYVHNYQHAASYPAFILSGVVDLVGLRVQLPQGTQQVFLSMAFFVEGFLMLMHKKHEPFDAMVHFLLGALQWACAAFILLQLWHPHSLWLAIGRAASCLMQGMWLWQIGTMLYTGRRQWKFSEAAPVGASVMMVPVVFAMLLLVNAVVMLAVWLISAWWINRTLAAYTKLPQVRQEVHHSPASSVDMDGRGGFGSDSAHEHSDDGCQTPPQKARPVGPGNARQQLRMALQVLRPEATRRQETHQC